MEKFYKITPEEANIIGRFDYDTNSSFDPFCGEQSDDSYLVSEKMYTLLKEHENFKKVDFSKKELIEEKDLEFKTFN